MPFIDDEQLAALYKEVDQEKKAAAFFQNLHQENKAKLLRYSIYRLGCFIAFALLMLGGIYFFVFSGTEDDPAILSRIEQLELENKILGGSTQQLQDNLKTVRSTPCNLWLLRIVISFYFLIILSILGLIRYKNSTLFP